MAQFNIKKLAKEHMKSIRVVEKILGETKLRITLSTFRSKLAQIERYARRQIIDKQRDQFTVRLSGILKKKDKL